MLKLSSQMVRKMMEVDGSLNFFKIALIDSMSFVRKTLSDSEFEKFITEIMQEVDVPKKMAVIYQEYYTVDDVLALIAFFKSSTGKKVLKFQTQIMPKVTINTQLIAAEMMVIALRKLAQMKLEPGPEASGGFSTGDEPDADDEDLT
jgi:hypothetical protein